MAKLLVLIAIVFVFVAVVSAQGGVKDLFGNYYDLSTGQYSSALTGRVYNTHVAPLAYDHLAAPYAAAYHHAPVVAAPYVAPYAAPLLFKK